MHDITNGLHIRHDYYIKVIVKLAAENFTQLIPTKLVFITIVYNSTDNVHHLHFILSYIKLCYCLYRYI